MPNNIPKSPCSTQAPEFTERLHWVSSLTHSNPLKPQPQETKTRKRGDAIPSRLAAFLFCAALLLFALAFIISNYPDSPFTRIALFAQMLLTGWRA